MLNHRSAVGLFALAIIGCGGNGGKGDGGGLHTDGGDQDSTIALQDSGDTGQDAIAINGTLSCLATLGCYLDNACADHACVDTCNQMAKNGQYASDATAVYTCVANAFQTTCASMCASTTDMGISECNACTLGRCVKSGTQVTCSGGACSMEAQTCFNEL